MEFKWLSLNRWNYASVIIVYYRNLLLVEAVEQKDISV